MQTLERLAKAQPDEDRLHSGLLLAYVNSLYRILARASVPSPLYRLVYDPATHHLQMSETQGNSQVPVDGALDITALDVVAISNLRDIPVLFEGETGVGKTYVSQMFLRTIFPKESYMALRLSGNTFLNNVFQPFLEGSIERGMPVTKIKQTAVDSIAGMFVDEINRGDPQNVLQLLDNELYNAGQFVKLGIRIPRLENGRAAAGPRRKKLEILTAQNPASTADAKFTSTLELDAAVDNRLLKTYFGNAANSAGTTLWLEEEPPDPHAEFLKSFVDLTHRYLGVDGSCYESLPTDWLSLYAWIADSGWTDKPILYTGLELADLMICVLGGQILRTYAYERQVVRDWCARFGLPAMPEAELTETERIKKLQQMLSTFKVPVIFRDIVQIKKLADVLATLRTIKEASKSKDPVGTYMKEERIVTVREVAGAAALLVRNKQISGAESAVPAVNEVMVHYLALLTQVQEQVQYALRGFNLRDKNTGIKMLILVKSIRDTLAKKGLASKLRAEIEASVRTLLKTLSATEELRNLLLVRCAGDLLTLCGFVKEYESEVDAILRGTPDDVPGVIAELIALYRREREVAALTMPEIYQHRVQRTLGG